MNKRIIFSIALITTLATAASAQTHFQATHPRRAEVNSRLHRQNARIHNEVKEGEMSKAKAARLYRNDHKIRQEERDMASQNHGHITRSEKRTLNQQENRNSNRIGR